MAGDLSDREHEGVAFAGLGPDLGPLERATFVDCTFTGCDLERLELRDCELVGCAVEDCNLSLLRPDGTRFSETVFRSSRLTGIDWTLAAWPNLAVGDLVAFDRCDLDHSVFMGLRLPDVRFHRCSMVDVDLSECDLRGASFVRCDLARAHLSATDLRGAHLEGATGYHIDARANQVRGTSVSLPEASSFLAQLGLELVDPPVDEDAD